LSPLLTGSGGTKVLVAEVSGGALAGVEEEAVAVVGSLLTPAWKQPLPHPVQPVSHQGVYATSLHFDVGRVSAEIARQCCREIKAVAQATVPRYRSEGETQTQAMPAYKLIYSPGTAISISTREMTCGQVGETAIEGLALKPHSFVRHCCERENASASTLTRTARQPTKTRL
jgi:hypothetical protein